MACRRVCRADQQQVERSNAPPLGEPTPQGWATRNRLKGAATRPWIEWVAGGFAGNQKKGQAKPNAHHLLRVCYETRSGVHKWCGPNSGSLHLVVTADKLWVLTRSA
jgi:hypothetical protein